MKHYKVELLAPAGDFSCFLAAIQAGADAVYLGGDKFGARAYANNFTEEEIIRAIRTAHLFERKVYLTVNTLVKEKEIEELVPYLTPVVNAGLDGVIIQDLGVFQMIREHFPGLELHASTQMTITGVYGAQLLKELGACRIVPARELSLMEIREIKERVDISIETFIHGAMCYAYSGQCLFSSILGGRSGNRGRCAGPCRLPYCDEAGNTVYPLSLKDMYTLSMIPQLIDAGIDSFKIEGRMKSPEYVAGVTAMYRKYIDKYLSKPNDPFRIAPEDEALMRGLYIRTDICKGYYMQHNSSEMVTLQKPGYAGCKEEILEKIRKRFLDSKLTLPIKGAVKIYKNEPCTLTLSYQEVMVFQEGTIASEALNRPLGTDDIRSRIDKLGDTQFHFEVLEVDTDEQSFLPVKAMNELRRNAVLALEEAIIRKNAGEQSMPEDILQQDKKPEQLPQTAGEEKEKKLLVLVTTVEQLRTVIEDMETAHIYVSCDLFLDRQSKEETRRLLQKHSSKQYYLALPHILRKRSYKYLPALEELLTEELFAGVLVRNLETLQWLHTIQYQGELTADYSIYSWNQAAVQLQQTLFNRLTLPMELNRKELGQLGSLHKKEIVLYGRIPLMYSANCVRKTLEKCKNAVDGSPVPYRLTDRYQNHFPVLQNCMHCYNILYNTVPLSLHGQLLALEKQNITMYRLEFTIENAAETKKILRYYQAAVLHGQDVEFPLSEYTNGHYKRGVE